TVHDIPHVPIFRLADEKNMARFNFVGATVMFDHKRVVLNCLTFDGVLQSMTKGVGANHTDNDRRFVVGKRSIGPFGELGEIIKKNRLELILTRNLRLAIAEPAKKNGECDEDYWKI